MPVISVSWRVWGKPGVQSRFQANLGYRMNPSPKAKQQKTNSRWKKKTHWGNSFLETKSFGNSYLLNSNKKLAITLDYYQIFTARKTDGMVDTTWFRISGEAKSENSFCPVTAKPCVRLGVMVSDKWVLFFRKSLSLPASELVLTVYLWWCEWKRPPTLIYISPQLKNLGMIRRLLALVKEACGWSGALKFQKNIPRQSQVAPHPAPSSDCRSGCKRLSYCPSVIPTSFPPWTSPLKL